MLSSTRDGLVEVDHRLLPDELNTMVFLCRDLIGASQLGSIKRGIDLCRQLERKFEERSVNGQTYTYIDLLRELLYHVGRMDLLKLLDTNKEKIRERLQEISLVNSYTLLLYEIRQDLTPDDLPLLKFHCGDSVAVDAATDPLDFFMSLEKQAEIGPRTLDNLEDMIGSIQRQDLLRKIRKYKSNLPEANQEKDPEYLSIERGISFPPHMTQHRGKQGLALPPSSGSECMHEDQRRRLYPDQPQPVQRAAQQERQQHHQQHHHHHQLQHAEEDEMGRYNMTATPRGYCIIINNTIFYQGDETCKQLPSREGSDNDKVKLEELFLSLHFMVSTKDNLKGSEMKTMISEYAARSHHDLDCLVVILLSHGILGYVYGADGCPVLLRDITTPFKPSNCPTLSNKPKVFIMQACQGKEKSMAYSSSYQAETRVISLEGDAPPSAPPTPHHHHHPQRPSSPERTLPNEADFLMANATVPGFVAYRSTSKGSWYINILVKRLKKHYQRHDLVSILTKVNQDIAEETAKMKDGHFKQASSLSTTLRKALFF